MTIQPIGADNAALFCTPEDLAAHGFAPSALTLEQAMLLLREACRPSGLSLQSVTELELFPDTRGVLIFAHLNPRPQARPTPRWPLRHSRVRRYPT